MGLTPAQVRAMTPEETELLVEGWNAAQHEQAGEARPMTLDELAELKRQYPDE